MDSNFFSSITVKPKTNDEIALVRALQQGLINKTEDLITKEFKSNDERYFDYYFTITVIDSQQIDLAKKLVGSRRFRVYKKFKTSQERTVLHAAVQMGNTDLITMLLESEASLDILNLDERQKTPFHLAIDRNEVSMIKLFLSKYDIKSLCEKDFLHYAIQQNKIKVVSHLIAKGFPLKEKSDINLTSFCVGLIGEHFKILDSLLSKCSMKDINPDSYDDIAPVHIASICGNLKIIKQYADSGLPINDPLMFSSEPWVCLENYSGFTLLHSAVKHVKLETVEFLLSVEADIFIENANGSTPLHIAFETKEKGFWKTWQDFDDNNLIIDLLLKANTKFDSNPVNNNGLSHFHIACSRDDPTVVEHFLKLGASVNQPVKPQCYLYKKFSPLHFAAKFRCKKAMKVLLTNGADVKQKNFQRMTPLHIAAKESCLDTVDLLLQFGADIVSVDSYGKTPVHWAFEKKNYEIIDLLLSVPNVGSANPTNCDGLSHFHIACTRDNVNVLKSFIECEVDLDYCIPAQSDKDNNSDITDRIGYSPLHFAVCHNRAKIVQILLNSGANVNIKDSYGLTPLHKACQCTHEMFGELIKNIFYDLHKRENLVLQLKPLTDIVRVYEKYSSGFDNSIAKVNWYRNRADHAKIIKLLLSNGSDVNCIDNERNAPIFHVCSAVYGVERRVLKSDLDCSDSLWRQVIESLTEELYKRRVLIVNNLLEHDVNLEQCFKNHSILHYICCLYDERNDEIMELFLKKGANVNARNEEKLTPLHQATLTDNKNLFSMLLNYGADIHCVDPKDNSTPMLIVTSKPELRKIHHEIIKILLRKGANPNARKSNGQTALHNLASLHSDSNIAPLVSALVEAGANVDSRDKKGFTPLHVACKGLKNYAVLLEQGADVNVEDNKGRNAYRYLYKKHLENLTIGERRNLPSNLIVMLDVLQMHIIKMDVMGLPVSEKVSNTKFDDFVLMLHEEKIVFIEKCQSEVQLLKDIKIHNSCTLFDVIFKSENLLSQHVNNSTFKAIVKRQSLKMEYPNYAYLVKLKYKTGVDRGNLLSTANFVLSKLAGMQLVDACTENICKHFTNAELRESTEILQGILDLNVEKSDDMPNNRRAPKRQRVY